MTDQSPTEHLLQYGNLSDAEVYAIYRFLRGITVDFELLANPIIKRYCDKQIQEADRQLG
jgi:hypothetical protein